ncbi:MAG: efflux RND transporter periplasmic adaptor subunit [Bacteroidetes bacterium]|nr:efflux RND transporter periplasmic adaptor subunit [Bacteroidota bacterium]
MMKPFLFIVAVLMVACSGKKGVVTPQLKPLKEAVYASGYVVSKNEYQVFSQVDGYVVDKLVNEGDAVKKGQPIFVIESHQQNARYNIAKETYNLALKNNQEDSPTLQEAKAALASAQSKFNYDSINFVRFDNLLKSNATSRNEYDRAKLTFENSRNDVKLQKSRVRKLRDQLSLDLKNSTNNLKIATEESGRYSVGSEIDGRVYKTLKEPGELVRRTEAMAIVGSGNQFYLQLNVDELDIKKIKVGQKVLAKIDALGEKPYEATVVKVYPIVDARDQSVRVDAEFDHGLPEAFSGLAVEGNILVRQKENALVIPKSYLQPGDSVIVKMNGERKKIKVQRGIETLDEVEIVDGLSAESQLMLK